MPPNEIFVFLHGFTQDAGTGGGGGQIAKSIGSLFNVTVEQPDLNVPSFDEFSVSNAIAVVDRLYADKVKQETGVRMNLIGASMGQ
jgi:hypothetical protein